MALDYIPAHAIEIPDQYTDDDTGITYTVKPDYDATDPRLDWDSSVALYVYRSNWFDHNRDPQPELTLHSTPVEKLVWVFARYYQRHTSHRALALCQRYSQLVYPDSQYAFVLTTLRGFYQSDWCDCLVVGDSTNMPDDITTNILNNYADEYRMYRYGSVYTVISDDPGDGPISGIYAECSEYAVQYYILQTS